MTIDLLTTSEVKQKIAKRFDEGWMLLFDNLDGMMITAIEKEYYSGDKNAGFEVFVVNTRDKLTCPLYLVKKEHYPFNKDTPNIENIRGIVITFNEGEFKAKSIRATTDNSRQLLEDFLEVAGINL